MLVDARGSLVKHIPALQTVGIAHKDDWRPTDKRRQSQRKCHPSPLTGRNGNIWRIHWRWHARAFKT